MFWMFQGAKAGTKEYAESNCECLKEDYPDENWVVLDGKIESIRDQPYGYVVFQSPPATSEISRVVVVLN